MSKVIFGLSMISCLEVVGIIAIAARLGVLQLTRRPRFHLLAEPGHRRHARLPGRHRRAGWRHQVGPRRNGLAQARAGNAIGLRPSPGPAASRAPGKDPRAATCPCTHQKTSNDASGALNNLFPRSWAGRHRPGVRTTQNDMNAFRGEIVKLNAEQVVLFGRPAR
jgi:hypothetical protein